MLTVLIAILILGAMLSFYSYTTILEGASNRASAQGNTAFYSAEAGLNTRAEALRQRFTQFERPSGTSPTKASDGTYCLGATNNGTADFACQSLELNGSSVKTYVVDKTPATPVTGVVPPGKINAGLSYQEYTYDLFSTALVNNLPASILQLRFRSRLIPLFQFAIFNQNDLDFSSTATFTVTGPVHTNGNMYFSSGGTLTLQSSVTAAGSMFRGFKDSNTCNGGTVQIVAVAGNTPVAMNCATTQRNTLTDSNLSTWNGRIKQNVGQLNVPTTAALSPTAGSVYWDQADLRIAYDVPSNVINVYKENGSIDAALTGTLNGCANAVSSSNTFRDNREQNSATAPTGTVLVNMTLLEVNVANLLTCINNTTGSLGIAGGLANTDQNGLVIHATVRGPNAAAAQSLYGVRLSNGANLQGAKGLTFVTDQAVYIQGNYNSSSKIPAAIIADTANILSNNWATPATQIPTSNTSIGGNGMINGSTVNGPLCPVLSAPTADAKSQMVLACRPATNTILNAAIVAGMSITGNANGTAGQDVNLSNGGPNNLIRYHEDWGINGGLTASATITYLGSLISLGIPNHATGPFRLGNPTYNPPLRNFSFDTSFSDLANLPPASPNAVYLVQERFVREFER
jgi:hypothetical protein